MISPPLVAVIQDEIHFIKMVHWCFQVSNWPYFILCLICNNCPSVIPSLLARYWGHDFNPRITLFMCTEINKYVWPLSKIDTNDKLIEVTTRAGQGLLQIIQRCDLEAGHAQVIAAISAHPVPWFDVQIALKTFLWYLYVDNKLIFDDSFFPVSYHKMLVLAYWCFMTNLAATV